MTQNNIYSTQKIDYHPDKIHALREGLQPYPVQVHLMPMNGCNMNCNFCSYRLEGNKNTQLFDRISYIPKDTIVEILDDFAEMGGRACELTGGGEPLLYPHKELMFDKIIEHGFDYALVTNGTLLTEDFAKVIAPKMMWARVSIDAGSAETYEKIRQVKPHNLYKAFDAVRWLRKYSENPEFRLGVGFVVTNDNYKEIFEFCDKAKQSGADNVRISAIFHPDGIKYFNKETIELGSEYAKAAEKLNDDKFRIYNLFDERIANVELGKQDYKFCGTKEMLCVIGGNCDVYTCCSLAFNKRGLIGNLREQRFKELWDSEEKQEFFEKFDASKMCKFMCLYESRNRHINNLLEPPLHANFL